MKQNYTINTYPFMISEVIDILKREASDERANKPYPVRPKQLRDIIEQLMKGGEK